MLWLSVVDVGFPRWRGTNLLFGKIVVENCIKIKKLDQCGGVPSTRPLDPLDVFDTQVSDLHSAPVCKHIVYSVTDPGFLQGGGANPRGGGWSPTYDFAEISQKLHEIERIWTPESAAGTVCTVNKLRTAATGYRFMFANLIQSVMVCIIYGILHMLPYHIHTFLSAHGNQ